MNPLIAFPLACFFYTVGILFCCTIIGLPIGLACFSAANSCFAPR